MGARRSLAALLVIASLVWALALVIVPATAATGSGVRVPPPISAIVYLVGTTVCHQRPERSFHPGGVRMPVCARCFGLYASAPLGAMTAVVAGMLRTRPRRTTPVTLRLILIAAACPTALVWAIEWFGLAQPSSTLRAGLAVPLGAAAGWIVTTAIAGKIE